MHPMHVQAMNMPCYLDEVSPRSSDFPEGHRYGKRPWDFGKIWWSLRLAQLGYTSLYLDNDVAAMRDPLAAHVLESPYDLQVGLCCVVRAAVEIAACATGTACAWVIVWLCHTNLDNVETDATVLLNRASATSASRSSHDWAPCWTSAAHCTGRSWTRRYLAVSEALDRGVGPSLMQDTNCIAVSM